jgi:hypothetical protein
MRLPGTLRHGRRVGPARARTSGRHPGPAHPAPTAVSLLAVLVLPIGTVACESVTVTTLEVASVEVSPGEESLLPGGRIQLSAVARDAGGRALPDRDIAWSSNDESIASVASDGLVTAHRTGVVRIVASAGPAQGTATLTVREVADPDDPETERDEQEADEGDGGSALTVATVRYLTTGGPDGRRHLLLRVQVEDASGGPVGGASVSVRTTNPDRGERWDLSGTTGGNGVVELRINNHPAGCYETEVTRVAVQGREWDGRTPSNGYCRS